MARKHAGRHRAPGFNPLTEIADIAAQSAQPAVKASAVVVASGGLLATFALPASAAPADTTSGAALAAVAAVTGRRTRHTAGTAGTTLTAVAAGRAVAVGEVDAGRTGTTLTARTTGAAVAVDPAATAGATLAAHAAALPAADFCSSRRQACAATSRGQRESSVGCYGPGAAQPTRRTPSFVLTAADRPSALAGAFFRSLGTVQEHHADPGGFPDDDADYLWCASSGPNWSSRSRCQVPPA